MNKSNVTFSALENAVSRASALEDVVSRASALEDAVGRASVLENAVSGASALGNVANRMSAVYAPPEIAERFLMAQKAISSPAYQAMVKQQEILSKMAIPASLMPEIQAANNLIQPALQNINFDNLTKIVQSENFLKSALAVQNASINFLEEMKKLDNYQQKTLAEILKEIRLKKNGELDLAEIESAEVELTENFPPELKESFKILFDNIKNLVLDNQDFIKFVAELIVHLNTTSEYGLFIYLSAFLLGISAMKIKRGENFGE